MDLIDFCFDPLLALYVFRIRKNRLVVICGSADPQKLALPLDWQISVWIDLAWALDIRFGETRSGENRALM